MSELSAYDTGFRIGTLLVAADERAAIVAYLERLGTNSSTDDAGGALLNAAEAIQSGAHHKQEGE